MGWIKRLLIATLIGIFSGVGYSATVDTSSPEVVGLLQAVDKGVPHATQVLEQAVNINSGSLNLAGVKRVGDLFAAEYKKLGFDVSWIDGAEFERAGHLVASYGEQGPKLLLIGHLDTVFASDSPFQQAEHIDDNHIKGPGITDMKGGDAVMLLALSALAETGLLDKLQVRVVLTGDEELRGKPYDIANAAMVDAAKWADYAIGFEDGDSDPETAVVGRRGAGSWYLKVTGKPAHSSQIFREDIGEGAILELARILGDWRQALRGEVNLTFNPGVVVAGTEVSLDSASGRGEAFGKSNVISQIAEASGDIRAMTPRQLQRSEQLMRKVLEDSLPHTAASLVVNEGYPPMPVTPGNEALLQQYSEVSQALGYGPVKAVDPRRAGAADISFAAAYVKGAIDGLGLLGEGGHTVDEVADMRLLPQQAKRAALLMYQLAGE